MYKFLLRLMNIFTNKNGDEECIIEYGTHQICPSKGEICCIKLVLFSLDTKLKTKQNNNIVLIYVLTEMRIGMDHARFRNSNVQGFIISKGFSYKF